MTKRYLSGMVKFGLIWSNGQMMRLKTRVMKPMRAVFLMACIQGGLPSWLVASDTPAESATFCRFVHERADDFAWENDLVAFRAYGPALRAGAENSGIDCWLKRVPYPIVNKWYALDKQGKPYHQDHGEGLDNYHVGSSAGTGGTGLWLDDKREPLETYVKHEVIACTRELSRFKLTYEREIAGAVYREEKTISIKLGQRLYEAHSVFTKDGKIAAGLPVCIGVTTHDGKGETFFDQAQGWVACWEKLDDSELGTAARMAPAHIVEIKEVKTKRKDESHIFIITTTSDDGSLDYEAGYSWKKAGGITSRVEWEKYLGQNQPDKK